MSAKLVLVAVAAMLPVSTCDGTGDRAPYTLYRSSIIGDLRIHLATFDADEGNHYNRNNCQAAAELFQRQPGVLVTYWCEQGRYKP